MVAWVSGQVSGYGRRSVAHGNSRAEYWNGAYLLASPGSVDVNGVTRLQYLTDDSSISSHVVIEFDAADFAAFPGTPHLRMVASIAPASAFSPDYVPTPSEIITESVASWTSGDYLAAPGTLTTDTVPPPDSWTPNTKYWYVIAPFNAVGAMGAVGDVDVNGRAVSLWTNRTPETPIITTPAQPQVIFSGATVNLAFSSKDPDRLVVYPSDTHPVDFNDVAGVQIQYAPVPTDEDPSPVWVDLPISPTEPGGALGRGWFIYLAAEEGETDGARQFWLTSQINIQCGGDSVLPQAGYLPTGEWQVRVRTFDYGHGYPYTDDPGSYPIEPPLMDGTFSYTPDTYPADNTSPWSEPVFISAAAQVLPPTPLSPKDNTAIVIGAPVTLIWKYRNTYVPPYAQATRTIEIRRRGETDWTPLVTAEASASASYLVTGYDFVSGNRYEWRVRVTDTDSEESDWSESAFFWIIPEPASGSVIPPAGEIIEGAALGCGTHRAFVFRRGGTVRVGEITDISYLDWDRVRDDISTSKIDVTGWGIDCGNLLAQLQPWAYEIVIFRDNGFTVDRVWEGPITLLTYERDRVVIHAKDVVAYAYRRIIKQAMSDAGNSPTAGATVVDRAMRVIQNVFAPDDPNVLAYLQVIDNDDDAQQYRSTPAYSRTAYEEVDDMAANAGLDYTAVGRAILLWGTKNRIGTLPEFRDKDLGSSPIVSVYGMSFANFYAISDGNGVHGEADRLNEDGEDPTYGLVEMLSSTWASDAAEEEGTYTEAGLETIRQSFADAAERSIGDRYPPPVVVRVPDNTTVNPDTVLSIQHLVPGVVVPLRSTGTLRTVVATQKLDSVKVVEQGGKETISITLSPFSRDDIEAEEGA